jgi:hypothetical protein
VPLATALCKNLPAENAQRQLSRPKPTRVVEPTEEEEEEEDAIKICYASSMSLHKRDDVSHP